MSTSAPRQPRSKARVAKAAQPAEPRLSRTRRPPELEVADWQTALRRQFGREQRFGLENLGQEPVFSDFRVHNPASGSGTHYRVAIRGQAPGQNFCTCPDYATNHLGTCKHIEFTLARLQARRGGKAALSRGFQSEYSEIWLAYAGTREVRFRAGTGCPPALRAQAEKLFDAASGGALPRHRLNGLEHLMRAASDCGHELRCHDDVWQLIAQLRDEAGRVIGYRALDRIGQTLAPVMLRRRKAEVLTRLPERVDNRILVPLTPEQRVHHDENGGIVTRIVSRWRKTGNLSDADQRRLQCALQNMRMACSTAASARCSCRAHACPSS